MSTQNDDPTPPRSSAASKFDFGTSPSGFSNVVTLVMSLFISGMLFCISAPNDGVRLAGIERVPETTARVFERELWVENSIEFISSEMRVVLRPFLRETESTNKRVEAMTAFEDVIDHRGYPPLGFDGKPKRALDEAAIDALRARRIVLCAESNRIEEAQGDLDRLTAKGNASFVDAVHRAYAKVKIDDARKFDDYDVAIAGDEWIGKRLQLRLAIATDDEAARVRLEGEIRARLETYANRTKNLGLAWTIPAALGFAIFLGWLARNRPDGPISTALSPPAWLFENGYAVLVRAAFFGIFIAFALGQLAVYFEQDAFAVWGTLIASLPLVFLLQRRLLAPLGLDFASTFGLMRLPDPLAWVAFTLGVFAVDQIGSEAIQTLTHMAGATSHWSEGLVPSVIWSAKPIALLDTIDACAWAPLFEELGCRGLLYLTLRRNYPAWQAALLSGAIFGAMHMYSLPGMMSITWSGFVWALAFERCRSLWPSIVGHAATNSLVFAYAWLFYR